MGKCMHLNDAVRRHSTPGSLLLLLFAFIVFGPKTIDALRGEPNLENHLAIITNSAGEQIVQDMTRARSPVYGVRAIVIEADDGSVICSTEHHNTWQGERNRLWRISALTSCNTPDQPYRICSHFSVQSDSGRQRFLGPFCSPVSVPGE